MNFRDMIYNKCKELGNSQSFDFLEYDQFVKKPNCISRILDNIDKINELYQLLLSSDFEPILRNDCNSIIKHNIHHAGGAYDVRLVNADNGALKGVIITVIVHGEVFVYKCGNFRVKDSEMSGIRAYRIFGKLCRKHGINLTKYEIENGEIVKQNIESPYIRMFVKYKRLNHVNHLDFNSAWGAGFCKDFPEFTPIIEELRQKDKLIPNMALGYCQSKYIDYKHANFAQSGINNCNRAIDELIEKLENDGFQIVGLNTDGIWYRDIFGQQRLYHDENEGTALGQWKNDHKDCEFMAYSDGQYWFIEDGKFTPRARGYYSYEQLKPREEWNEYDFDKAMGTQVIIEWDEKVGFKYYE